MSANRSNNDPWPALPFREWKDTCATLHMWAQMVGKIRLVQTPWVNHSWHTTLYITSRGLTASPVPYGTLTFEIDFDFIDHKLLIRTSNGSAQAMQLVPRSVADFYNELFSRLTELGLNLRINTTPNEVVNAVPFDRDEEHASYDAAYANRFWRALVQADRVFKQFRARFIGKCSPVHFFWGSFDLAVTRFSGRRAPQHPGGVPHLPDWVAREAYSHEVSSCGFWPGSDQMPRPVFYAYAYPEPGGFPTANIGPRGAAYNSEFNEFILPYDEVRQAGAAFNAGQALLTVNPAPGPQHSGRAAVTLADKHARGYAQKLLRHEVNSALRMLQLQAARERDLRIRERVPAGGADRDRGNVLRVRHRIAMNELPAARVTKQINPANVRTRRRAHLG